MSYWVDVNHDILFATSIFQTTTNPLWRTDIEVAGVHTQNSVFDLHVDIRMKIHFQSVSRTEGNVLFNKILNTFYLRLYSVKPMEKDHWDSERGNPLPPLHELLSSLSSKIYFIHYPTGRLVHTMAFATQVAGTWNGTMGPSCRGRSDE